MAVIKHGIEPGWHEIHLLIEVLNRGFMPKKQLFKHIREQQKEKIVLGERRITHSDSAYRYWLKSHIEHQLAIEKEEQVGLTSFGKWIANSEIGKLEDRYLFISNLTCLDCTKAGYVVILKPEKTTATTRSNGTLFMGTDCPRCGQKENRTRMSDGLSLSQFIRFYDRVISELRKVAQTMSRVILSNEIWSTDPTEHLTTSSRRHQRRSFLSPTSFPKVVHFQPCDR
jgi:hypothetical protein